MVRKYLLHDSLWVRFGVLLVIAALVFVSAWAIGYAFLPEGLLRGKTAGQALAGTDLAGGSVWWEGLRIFIIKLAAMGLFVAINLLRGADDTPLGWVAVVVNALILGLVTGTNSFTLPQSGKIAPSLAILGSSGVYEIAAYVLAAAATSSIARYRLVGKWGETIRPATTPVQDRQRNVGVGLAILPLALACGWEAVRVAQTLAD